MVLKRKYKQEENLNIKEQKQNKGKKTSYDVSSSLAPENYFGEMSFEHFA